MFSMEVTRLIERCRQGDADALGELYKAYAQKMRGVCRRYVSDEQTISDVLHDSFVIIFTSFGKLRDDSKAEAWMMAITKNVASKYKDHLAKMTFVPQEDAEHLPMPEGESEVRSVPLEDVMQLVDRLPEGYGQVFRLSVFEGLSHQEIANMMGIEPHSSSSQLARAKKMLRKMMQHYWVATLLLLLVPIMFYLFRKGNTSIQDEKPVVANHKDTRKKSQMESLKESRMEDNRKHQSSPHEPMIVHLPKQRSTITTIDSLPLQIAQVTGSTTADTLMNMVAQEQPITDTITNDTSKTPRELDIPHYDIAHFLPQKPATVTRPQPKWSVNLAYVGGFGEHNYNRPYGFTETPMIATTGEPPSPVTFENWSDYAAFLAEMPDDGSSHNRSIIMNIALNNAKDAQGTGNDKIVCKSHHYMPINFSLALKYQLNHRFALETGVSYSRLKSEFEIGSNGNTINEQHTIHYLGIPVKGTYNIFNRKAWNLYGTLGVTTDIPLYSPLNTSYYLNGILEATDKSTIHAPWQWSVGTGLGLQYNFTPNIGLFAEPSLQYYIPTGTQIETYRTEHPFNFSLPIGIKFTW